ncbi:MAG: TSUP family transporter [Betaproteobacteria bacterium]
MFGTGGFIYAMYLGRRLEAEAMRATQSALLSLSTIIRVTIFALAGVYADPALLLLFALMLPAMVLGLFAGHRVRLRLSRAQFFRVLYALLAASGAALVWRALALS